MDWIQQQPNASWDRDYPREAGNKVLGEVSRLGHRQMMAECREETLRQHGLKYDSERQMAIPLGGKGRPSLFINRMIGMQAIVLRSTYSKPEDLRKEIHRRLSRFFPIPESEAGERGKIARAIENAGREVPKRSVRNNQQKGRNPA